jgi:hypothetical protein
MGLTIYYKLFVAENLSSAVVRELANRTALYARKIGCAEVGEILRAESDASLAPLFVRAGEERDCCFGHVPAKRGWLVEVWPGEGCESATFGLCQYPRRAEYALRGRYGTVRTDYTGGWLLKGSCKTQYAAEHGTEHFVRCHRMIVSILVFWRQLGATVEVSDEGEYWETRSEAKLRAILNRYNGLVAAVAGAFKDAAGETGDSHAVESPMFARKDFERLEAEGWREFGKQLSQRSCLDGSSA